MTVIDHRNGHHTGRDRCCWRCTLRAVFGRTPKPIKPMRSPDILILDDPPKERP